jgi:hypothetical protein
MRDKVKNWGIGNGIKEGKRKGKIANCTRHRKWNDEEEKKMKDEERNRRRKTE